MNNFKGNCHEQLTWKRQPELSFKFDSRRHQCKAKPPAYDGPLSAKEITSDKKSRFREWKVARKPGMLPQTNLLKCMRSSWQFPLILDLFHNGDQFKYSFIFMYRFVASTLLTKLVRRFILIEKVYIRCYLTKKIVF